MDHRPPAANLSSRELDRREMVEPVLEPALPIVDPHHHLWDRRPGLDALPTSGWGKLSRESPVYLLDELLADLKCGHDVRATIYMECGSFYRADGPPELRSVGETEFANGVAAMSASGVYGDVRVCAGIVANADLTLGDAVHALSRPTSRRAEAAFAACARLQATTPIRTFSV